MIRLLIALLSVVATFAQAAEEVCGYCILPSDLRIQLPTPYDFKFSSHTDGSWSIPINGPPEESVVRSNHVCTGPVLEVLPSKLPPYKFVLNSLQPPYNKVIYRPHLRLCDGELIQLDEYRLRPFKDFGKVLVTGERKEFLERINTMAKNVEPEKVEATVRKLLEEKDGPLAKQRAALVTETTDAVVKLISTAPPKKN